MQFSEDWFRQASDEEIDNERESIRLQYVVEQDIEAASAQYDLLHQFNDEQVRRANEQYAIENPEPQPRRHREHGWYLSNDD
ncbi:hypothetical protein GS491_26570 [Rhodococcus hoagii]|nr:hypothetical protein [Prescottella equi]NKR80685.1 hypothetical protein [Prescottella equi]NKS99569.1 hypothetical protein [Prescottella equi]